MLKVALLSSDIDIRAGWGSFTYELCSQFYRRKDISFQLYLPAGSDIPADIEFPERIHTVLPQWTGSFSKAWHRIFPFVFPRIKIDDVDVIHSLVEFPYGVLAQHLARHQHCPYIICTQGTYAVAPFRNMVDRWLFKPAVLAAKFVTAPSSFTATALAQIGHIKHPVTILHNAVNYDRFQQAADQAGLRRRLGLLQDVPIVLGVGGLKRRKGFDIVIKAFQSVLANVSHANLVIVGNGPLRADLELLVKQLGIDSQVHLIGNVEREDLIGLYQTCEVYTHLPINAAWNFEGFGMVYLEAGACGKPSVASRSGGVPDAVLDGETGILVDEGSVEQAAQAMVRLLTDKELARRMGSKAREYARGHQWDWYANQIIDLYSQAIER